VELRAAGQGIGLLRATRDACGKDDEKQNNCPTRVRGSGFRIRAPER
jgi:hypothetical protein